MKRKSIVILILAIIIAGILGVVTYQFLSDDSNSQNNTVKEKPVTDASSESYISKGDAYESQDDNKDAVPEYSKAYDMDQHNIIVVNKYSQALLYDNQSDLAYAVIRGYLALAPLSDYWNNGDYWINRASAALGTHRCSEATFSINHALEVIPPDTEKATLAQGLYYQIQSSTTCDS